MRALLPIIFLVLAAAGYLGLTKCKQKLPPKPPEKNVLVVETHSIQPETIRITLQTQGTIRSTTGGTLNVEVPGRIITVSTPFQAGGRFKKGDLLLTIDPTNYKAAKAQAEAALARAQLALHEEQARAEQARKEWAAAKNLTSDKATPLVLREPQLALARAEVNSAKQSVALAQLNVERTQLRAPYNGILTEKLADIGQVVGGGSSTAVAKAYCSDKLEVRLPIPSNEINFLNLSAKPEVLIHAVIGGQTWTWKAKVDRDRGSIDPQTRFHFLIALIDMADKQAQRPELQPGQFVAATIHGKTLPNLYRVPRHAFVEENALYLVTPENTLIKREVDILHHMKNAALVKSGLAPGDTLCLTRLQFMNDGLKVQRADDPPIQETSTDQ
jgi:membrane fusion protein, multidrug efflux system